MAKVQHTCTGCVPIDASIIDVYIQLLGLKDSTNAAAERAEYAAEHAIGKSPYIGENGDWWEWDDERGEFIDTMVQAQGSIAVDTQLDPTSTNPVQNKVTTQALAGKQATLVSGTNIKTINDESILGAGNIVAGDPNAVKYVDQSLTDAQKSQARTNIGAGTYSKAGTGIPKSDLASSVQTSLGKADTAIQDISGKQDVISDLSTIRSGAAAGATAYQKPGTGIPSTDMTAAVQASLAAADSASKREYNSQSPNGMGYLVLEKDKTFASQVTDTNTIYEIRYAFVLTDDFQIPSGCVLDFRGGSIDGAFTLDLNDCQILGTNGWIGTSLSIGGKTTTPASPDWFAGSSDSEKITRAIASFGVVQLGARDYIIDSPIIASESFSLYGFGFCDTFGLSTNQYKTDNSASILRASSQLGNGTNDCILKLTGVNMSCAIVGVSFLPTIGENENLVTGIYSNTVGGPARPVVIERCNFKYLDCGIYVNKSGGANTGVMLSVQGCNISRNNYGLRADGVHTIVNSSIINNNLEQNNTAGIYFGDSSNNVTLYGAFQVSGNILEGQDLPIFVTTGIGVTIEIKDNYFERTSNPQYIKLIGKTGLTDTVIAGNICSSNLSYLAIYASSVKVTAEHNYHNDKMVIYGQYILNRNSDCAIYNPLKHTGITLGTGEEDVYCATPDNNAPVKNTATPTYSLNPAPTAVIGDKFVTKRDYDSSSSITFKSMSIAAGSYILVFALYTPQGVVTQDVLSGVRLRIRQNSVDFWYKYLITCKEGKTFIVAKVTVPASANCTFYLLNQASVYSSVFVSNIDLYAVDANLVIPQNESYSDDTSALVLDSSNTGLFRMNAGKPNWWNGTAWVDATGVAV